MLAFVVWSLLLCNCFGDKEYPEDFASILGDDLFLELEKRLMDYSDINQQHSSNTKCTFATENNLIIKTKISLDQGAIFIDSPVFGDDEINPRLSCRERCCETEDCNLAVFKEKVCIKGQFLNKSDRQGARPRILDFSWGAGHEWHSKCVSHQVGHKTSTYE